MSASAIQQFLNDKGSVCLRSYNTPSIDGNNNYGGNVSAATAIKQASDLWQINPQVLLAKLQKENSLITRTTCPSFVYQSSMGLGCPDTAACDPQYAGFSRQAYQSARWLRNYFNQTPGWYTLKPGINYIQYSPTSSCGGSNINIVNRATAALYTFTPYQPNAASIAAGNGVGDGCSSHGNRNFWIYFTDWFGSTYANDAIYAMADNGDPRQWLLVNGNRYYVPSADVVSAWGLDKKSVVKLNANYLGSFRDSATISRFVRSASDGAEFLVDGGNNYHFVSGAQETAWRADDRVTVDNNLIRTFLTYKGDLGYSVGFTNESGIYMVDDGMLRQYGSVPILQSTEDTSKIVTISSSYKSRFVTGAGLSSNTIRASNQTYVMDSGRKMALDTNLKTIYGASNPTEVSELTAGRLANMTPSYLVKGFSGDAIYLIDGGKKRQIGSIPLLRAYAKSRDPSNVAVLSDAAIASLYTTASSITTTYTSDGVDNYVIDGRAIKVPSDLRSAYIGGKTIDSTPLSAALVATIGSTVAQPFVSDEDGKYYAIDGSTRRWIKNLPVYISLTTNDNRQVTKLDYSILNTIAVGADISSAFVKNGATTYYLADGKKYIISAANIVHWGEYSATNVDTSTLNRYASSGNASNLVSIDGATYLVHNGQLYRDDKNNADVWTSDALQQQDNNLFSYLLRSDKSVTLFARSTDINDGRIFLKDTNNLIHVSGVRQLQNFAGTQSTETLPLTPAQMSQLPVTVSSLVSAVTSNDSIRLIVNGQQIAIDTAGDSHQWRTIDAPSLSSELLSILRGSAQTVSTTVIRAQGQSTIYSIENGVKRWIYYTPYVNRYSTKTVLDLPESFVEAYPTGTPITN
ncbi:hypothetical protein EON76_01460 [bacterium]|nr:MAG: hypothetical protein EON76_01460 [bacterium]